MNSKQKKQTAKAYFAKQGYNYPKKNSKRTEQRIKDGEKLTFSPLDLLMHR